MAKCAPMPTGKKVLGSVVPSDGNMSIRGLTENSAFECVSSGVFNLTANWRCLSGLKPTSNSQSQCGLVSLNRPHQLGQIHHASWCVGEQVKETRATRGQLVEAERDTASSCGPAWPSESKALS